jgi:hypothetical protein
MSLLMLIAMVGVHADAVSLPQSEGGGGGTDFVFQYDDGTAGWLTWGGSYRGVWFNAGDFFTDAVGVDVSMLEFWFFHHASYPWDVASFYAELWNGTSSGPAEELASASVMAMHMTPVYAEFDPPIAAEGNFWALVNTKEMSAGGWPSVAADANSTSPPHSFYWSGSAWEPAIADYLFRAHGEPVLGLEEATWGSIKGLFGR